METNNQKNDQNIIPNDADKQQKGVNVPNLRFKEYCKNWTIEPMENVCKFFKGHGISKEDLSDTGNPCILYGELYTTYKTAIAKTIKSRTLLDLKSLVHSKSNDVLIPCSGETAEDISTSICIPYDDVLIGGDLTIIRSQLNGAFLSNQINSVRKLAIARIAQGKSIVHLQADELKKINISFPTIDEQLKIATFVDLLDLRIDTQSKIIEKYESLISTIRTNIFSSFQGKWTKLCDLVENKSLQLNRGNIIPKHPKDDVYKYPVYSSSVQKDGLMGYSDYYMFDKELITWSIDGGGDIFFREKHKFCVTNVCGILQLDTNKFSYRFVAEALKYQHSKTTFDYQTKAHPSVIEKLYALPDIELNKQDKYSKLFGVLYSKLGNERKYLEIIKEQKKYLLSNMFI